MDAGDCDLSLGMDLSVLSTPLHKLCLSYDLVQGEVCVGVSSALPVKGVDGNGFAGGRVWPDVPRPPVVNLVPVFPGETGESAHNCPKVFTACSVAL